MENEHADAERGRLNPFRETKFSGTYGDMKIFIFPVQLTTGRIGNLDAFDPYSALRDEQTFSKKLPGGGLYYIQYSKLRSTTLLRKGS